MLLNVLPENHVYSSLYLNTKSFSWKSINGSQCFIPVWILIYTPNFRNIHFNVYYGIDNRWFLVINVVIICTQRMWDLFLWKEVSGLRCAPSLSCQTSCSFLPPLLFCSVEFFLTSAREICLIQGSVTSLFTGGRGITIGQHPWRHNSSYLFVRIHAFGNGTKEDSVSEDTTHNLPPFKLSLNWSCCLPLLSRSQVRVSLSIKNAQIRKMLMLSLAVSSKPKTKTIAKLLSPFFSKSAYLFSSCDISLNYNFDPTASLILFIHSSICFV